MNIDLRVNDIISQVKKLDRKDQLTLMDRLFFLIRKREIRNVSRISSLSNANDQTWKDVDIEKYIEEERQW